MSSNIGVPICFCALSLLIPRVSASDAAQEWGPFPSVVAAAQADKIPLEEMDSFVATNAINPGDSLTALVTLHEKGDRRTQWLIYLEAVTPTAEEQARTSRTTLVIHNTLGTELKFVSSPAFVTVRTLDPYSEPGAKTKVKAHDQTARISLDKGFLALGLDQAAAAFMRLKDNQLTALKWGTARFSESQINESRRFAEVWKLTSEEERALGGSQPALHSYLRIVQSTPGLENIVAEVLPLRSKWSLVRHGGVSSTTFLWQADRVELKRNVYTVPMRLELNKQPALNLTLMVTKPQPPILSSAGIIALIASKSGDGETFLMLRVLSARLATGAK